MNDDDLEPIITPVAVCLFLIGLALGLLGGFTLAVLLFMR